MVEGNTYALIFDAFVLFDGEAGGTAMRANFGYEGGSRFIFRAHDGTREEHFLSYWGDPSPTHDISFTLSFDPIPEPTTLTLATITVLGICGRRRRRG